MWDKLLQGLEILLRGMAGIFLVAFVIVIFVILLNKFTNIKKSEKE